MALSKTSKLLLSISCVVGIGAIGIGTGLGISANNSQSNLNSNEFDSSLDTTNPVTKPNSSLNLTDLDKLINEINESSIVIHPFYTKEELAKLNKNNLENKVEVVNTNITVEKTNLFAFNVKKQQLSLKSTVQIDNDVSVELKLNEQKNTVSSLNQGKLSIDINLSQTGNTLKQKTLDLTGFKTPDEELIKLFASSNMGETMQKNSAVLEITPMMQSGNSMEFVSLEQLNSTNTITADSIRTLRTESEGEDASKQQTKTETGLTTWLKKDSSKMLMNKDISISGQVKLDKIEMNQNKVNFILSSADKNNPLKLIKMMDGKISSEALIQQIKTTNLLATDLTIIPNDYDQVANQTYVDSLSKLTEKDKYLVDETNSYLNRFLSVNLSSTIQDKARINSRVDRLFVKPFLFIRSNEMDKKDKLPLSAVITYGSGINARRFNTNNKQDLEILKAAGFKFNVYSKKLESDKFSIGAQEITKQDNKLSTFFKEDNYKTGVMKPITGNSPMADTGNFKLTTLPTESNNGVVEIDLGMEMIGSGMNMKIKPENYLIFGDYSFTGLMDKVVFNPVIDLVHVTTSNPDGSLVKTQMRSISNDISQ